MLKYQAVTRWDSIELFKNHVRGYGYADLLYDNDTHYGLNIGWCGSEYQDSVHPEEGGYKKLKSVLENETPIIRKGVTTLLGKDSDCTLFPIMSSAKLIKIVECMHAPIPRADIIEEVENYKKGITKSWDICDRVFNLKHIINEKKVGETCEFHDIQYVLYNMHDGSTYAPETSGYHYGHPGPDKSKWSYGPARMIAALYPDDKELFRAVEDYCHCK